MDSSRKRSNLSANSKRTSPAGVSSTDLAERSRSLALYACSSWRICALTADCERKTFWPAREKLFSLATKTNVVSWSKTIFEMPGGDYSESPRQMRSLYPTFRGVFGFEKREGQAPPLQTFSGPKKHMRQAQDKNSGMKCRLRHSGGNCR